MTSTFTFEYAEEIVLRFEQLLASHNIKVRAGSDLEDKACGVFGVLYRCANMPTAHADDRALLRSLMGVQDLATKLLAVAKRESFRKLLPHMRLLNSCSVTQNAFSPMEDQDANKIIELYVAALCLRETEDVDVDSPEDAMSRNPDVIAALHGRRWGFACKTPHSSSPQTLFDHIENAAKQVQCSDASIGIPVLNLKNLIEHEVIWPANSFFLSADEPIQLLRSRVEDLLHGVLEICGKRPLENVFHENPKCVPAICWVAQAATGVLREGQAVATRLNTLTVSPIIKSPVLKGVESVLATLNEHMQDPTANSTEG